MALLFISEAKAAGAASAEHAAKVVFPPFDASTFPGQLFWLLITFGLTYLLMRNVALPRVKSILDDRQGRIDNDLKEAEAAHAAASDASKQFETNLAQAKGNAQGIAAAARDSASKEAEDRRQKVEAELGAKLAQAEKTIADTKAKAMGNVTNIAQEAAAAIVERLSGAAPTAKAVTEAIASVARKEA